MRDFFRRHWVPLSLGLLFLAQFLIVSPRGEFALNDDWVHTEMIAHWVETGEFRFNSYVGPLLYWPILYGAAVVKLFGFSFTWLRVTTLVWMAAAIALTYAVTWRLSHQRGLAATIALLVWLNPISYNLSFTFMTDIPALALTIASAAAYWRALESRQGHWVWLGSTAALLGFFTRQTAGLLAPAFGIYLLWLQWRGRSPLALRQWLWPLLTTALTGATAYAFLYSNYWLPGGTSLHSLPLNTVPTHAAWWIWYIFIYTGLLAAPLAAGLLWQKKLWRDWRWWTLVGTSVAIVMIIKLTTDTQLPYVLNIINVFGLGPNKNVLNGVLQFQFPAWVWGAATVGAASSAATLVYTSLTKSEHQPWWLWAAMVNAVPLLMVESFDRYILPVTILFCFYLVSKLPWTRAQTVVALTAIAIISLYSVSQTSFYLRLNQARWQLAEYAANQGDAPRHTIDGGYEWNGWYSYWNAQASGRPHGTWTAPWWIRALFVNNTEDYIVSFSPLPPYQVVSSTTVLGINPNNHLYLLRNPRLNRQ